MHLRHIPFPVLMFLGCVTLVWAVQQPRHSAQAQQLSRDAERNPAAAQTPTAGQSWTGVVSDSNCGAKHAAASDRAAQCVSRCVASGAKYVLVSAGSVFQIDPQDQFATYAGKAVSVQGSLHGDTITAATVSPVPQQK
ncbi:MAG: hypothetical protein ACRD3T_17060 [Terriglobia bacterium]